MGQQVNLTSTIVVVPGRSERGVMIEQELAIVDGTGEIWGQSQRREVNRGISAGGFRTSFSFPISSYLRRGAYTLRMRACTSMEQLPAAMIRVCGSR